MSNNKLQEAQRNLRVLHAARASPRKREWAPGSSNEHQEARMSAGSHKRATKYCRGPQPNQRLHEGPEKVSKGSNDPRDAQMSPKAPKCAPEGWNEPR